jgi:hypothetical protein
VPALFIANTTIRDCVAPTVPSVDPLDMTKFAGVPLTVVTAPELSVVPLKSNVSAEAEIVIALDATLAEIG